MSTLRTPKTEHIYQQRKKEGHLDKGCRLCIEAGLTTFKHWKILNNKFPYDRIAKTHHMLVPYRHAVEEELSAVEMQELKKIKDEVVHTKYEYILEAADNKKTIPGHFHLHLLVLKDDIGE